MQTQKLNSESEIPVVQRNEQSCRERYLSVLNPDFDLELQRAKWTVEDT